MKPLTPDEQAAMLVLRAQEDELVDLDELKLAVARMSQLGVDGCKAVLETLLAKGLVGRVS